MNRAAVFVFFDKNGIADRYIDVFLNGLKPYVSRLVVVCNGSLSDESRALFAAHTDEILVRENKGYDAWAYKAGLDALRWERLSEYDEVLLCNDTVFGPVYPLGEMFGRMGPQALDFWGLTRHEKLEDDEDQIVRKNRAGHIPAHIQSYFLVFRRKLAASKDFRDYWAGLPAIARYADAVGKFETTLTKHFEDLGYLWDSYVKPENIETDAPNFTVFAPLALLEEHRLPLLKTRLFKQDTLNVNAGEQTRLALEFLKQHTDYDTDLIWESILRRFHQYDLVRSLGLAYVLPADVRIPPSGDGRLVAERRTGASRLAAAPVGRLRAALVMHVFYPESSGEALRYARSMPDDADVFLTTDTQEKAEMLKRAFSTLENLKEVRVVANRGRSESALIVGMADAVGQYDVLCFWKEKVSKQVDYHAAKSWGYKISENLLCSKDYVENVIETFARNPRLGMLAVTPPVHALYWWVPGNEWTVNFDNTKALAERLGLRAPMSRHNPPVTSFGGALWFRAAAMRKLFEHPWAFADFPEEPLPTDGSLLHAIERIYSFVAQDAGYYPAYVLNDRYAALEVVNLSQVLRSYNEVVGRFGGGAKNYFEATQIIGGALLRPFRHKVKGALKRMLPRTLYLKVLDAKRAVVKPREE